MNLKYIVDRIKQLDNTNLKKFEFELECLYLDIEISNDLLTSEYFFVINNEVEKRETKQKRIFIYSKKFEMIIEKFLNLILNDLFKRLEKFDDDFSSKKDLIFQKFEDIRNEDKYSEIIKIKIKSIFNLIETFYKTDLISKKMRISAKIISIINTLEKEITSEVINIEIDTLTKKLKELELNNEDKTNLLESERLEKERLINELEFKNKQLLEVIERENKLKANEHERIRKKENISKAIMLLNKPAKELRTEKIYNRKRRTYYTNISEFIFTVSAVILILYIYFIYNNYLETDKLHSLNFSSYLFSVFPLVFSTLIGFLFLRQANIKSNEIKEIDKRFILINDVYNSLQAINELKEDNNNKTEEIIDKLIDNILNQDKNNEKLDCNDINKTELLNLVNLINKFNSNNK